MALVEAYFDESGVESDSAFLVVAGYVFEYEKSLEMVPKWQRMLSDFGLDYFHMTDCAVDPGFGKFANLSKPQRIEVATAAIALIKKYATHGVAFSVEKKHAHLLRDFHGLRQTTYTFACWQALIAVRHWIRRTDYKGDVSYIFEDGHQSKPDAQRVLDWLFADEHLRREEYRCIYHGFADKRKFIPLQCADILAWHWCKEHKNQAVGRKRRADFEALIEMPEMHYAAHYDEAQLRKLRREMDHEQILKNAFKYSRYV